MKRFDSISIALLVILFSIFGKIGYDYIKFLGYQSWQVTNGVVTDKSRKTLGGTGSNVGKGPLLTVDTTVVSYKYWVNGEANYGQGSPVDAIDLREGTSLDVYYNPATPERSVVDISFNWPQFFTWLFFGLIVIIADVAWFNTRRKVLGKN